MLAAPSLCPTRWASLQNTFWVDDQVVTCSGYTAASLTGCTVGTAIAGNATDTIQNFSTMNAGTSVLGGFIKVERQNANDSTWHDITAEILGYGIGAPSQSGSCSATDPSPNAILRLQRYADDAWVAPCILSLKTVTATDYWPNTLFDTREAWARDVAPVGSNIKLGGVMHYVMIDAQNAAKWFTHAAPYNTALDTGNLSKTDASVTGYSIYISDRRNNRDALSRETAEYGYEDFVNPLSATGAPNGTLDAGEDLNANTVLDVYGGFPNCNGTYNSLGPVTVGALTVTCASNASTPRRLRPLSDFSTAADPLAVIDGVGRAMVNRPIIFRRAVKLVTRRFARHVVTGLTVVTENPVYVQGDWNAVEASPARMPPPQ